MLKMALYLCYFIIKMQKKNSKSQQNSQKVRIPLKHKGDYGIMKQLLSKQIDEQIRSFNGDQTQKVRFKNMMVQFLNLSLKAHKQLAQYVEDDVALSSEDQPSAQDEDELLEEKTTLLKRALEKKIEQSKRTIPTQLSLQVNIPKPDNLYIIKNGVQVPVESHIDYSQLSSFSHQIQKIHEKQLHYCEMSRQIFTFQRWLSDSTKQL